MARPKSIDSDSAVLDEPAEKTYRVMKGQVGPWNAKDPAGNSFSMSQFKMVTAFPATKVKNPNTGEFEMVTNTPAGIDPETYWEGLINRLIVLEVIRYEPGLIIGEIPLGPECGPRYATLNQSQQIMMQEAAAIVAKRPLEASVVRGERHSQSQRIEPSEIGAPALRPQ